MLQASAEQGPWNEIDLKDLKSEIYFHFVGWLICKKQMEFFILKYKILMWSFCLKGLYDL